MNKILFLCMFFFNHILIYSSDKKSPEEGKKPETNTRKFTWGSVSIRQSSTQSSSPTVPSATQRAHANILIDNMSPNSAVFVLHHAAQKVNNTSQTTTLTPAATVALSQASSAVASATAIQVTRHMRQGSHEHKKDSQKKPTPPKQGDLGRRPAFLAIPHPTELTGSPQTPKSARTTPLSRKNHTRHGSLEHASISSAQAQSPEPTAYEWTARALDSLAQKKATKEKQNQNPARPRQPSDTYHASPSVTPARISHGSPPKERGSIYADYVEPTQPQSPASAPASPVPQNPANSMHMSTQGDLSDGLTTTMNIMSINTDSRPSTSSDNSEE